MLELRIFVVRNKKVNYAIAFDCYIDLASGSIDSLGQIKSEFLNCLYKMWCIVGIKELTNTRQQNDKSVIDYINRWRALALKCKYHIPETLLLAFVLKGWIGIYCMLCKLTSLQHSKNWQDELLIWSLQLPTMEGG